MGHTLEPPIRWIAERLVAGCARARHDIRHQLRRIGCQLVDARVLDARRRVRADMHRGPGASDAGRTRGPGELGERDPDNRSQSTTTVGSSTAMSEQPCDTQIASGPSPFGVGMLCITTLSIYVLSSAVVPDPIKILCRYRVISFHIRPLGSLVEPPMSVGRGSGRHRSFLSEDRLPVARCPQLAARSRWSVPAHMEGSAGASRLDLVSDAIELHASVFRRARPVAASQLGWMPRRSRSWTPSRPSRCFP